jgi:hypothetical protein
MRTYSNYMYVYVMYQFFVPCNVSEEIDEVGSMHIEPKIILA